MSATFEIRKYVGKDCTFGTPVSSIGIKRVDAVVPAVYGNPIVPGDDKTDVNTYAVYRPDEDEDIAYSYESIFKLILKTAPSNQLSNIRIYPATAEPDDDNKPLLYIGCTQTFSRPTNVASLVATHNIWDYTEDDPFLVTVGGEEGQTVDEQVAEMNYNADLHDIGAGNVIYMNEERQITIPIVEGNNYQIINQVTSLLTLQIYDENGVAVSNADITYTTVEGHQVVSIAATASLYASYPNGFKYGSNTDVTIGGLITWLDLTEDPIETVDYEVRVELLASGEYIYTLNGERGPVLNFRQNRLYRFTNKNGDTDPIRFLNSDSTIANVESEIIIDGITVTNGHTVNEVVLVDPKAIVTAGYLAIGYQSTAHNCYGNTITNTNTATVGNYNVDGINCGTKNPLHAGETDYIYLQLKVTGASTVGQTVPELVIEYDEN